MGWTLPEDHSMQTPSQDDSKARTRENSHCSKGLEMPLTKKKKWKQCLIELMFGSTLVERRHRPQKMGLGRF